MKRVLERLSPRAIDAMLAVLCLVQIALVLTVVPAGAFSVDEVTHVAMLRALVSDHALSIASIAPDSAESQFAMVRPHAGALAPQYPHGYTFFVAPLYAIAGIRGVMVVSTLAFYGTAAVLARLARGLWPSRVVPALAVALFLVGTYSWEYSVAIWPHAATVLTCTLGMHCAFIANRTERLGRAAAFALCAGGFLGVGISFRLDAAFMVGPALMAPPLLRPRRSWLALIVPIGLTPAITFLSITNHHKFGTMSPFSYGPEPPGSPTSGIGPYVPLVLVALLVCVTFWWWRSRPPALRARIGVALLALLVLTVAIVPPVRLRASEIIEGLVMLGVDLRVSDPRVLEPALSRGATNAMIYAGTVKKSLLQSLPWLPLVLALFALARPGERRKLIAVAAAALAPFSAFAAFRWHGGMSFNLRYLLVAMPFLALLGAVALRRLTAQRARGHSLSWDRSILVAASGYLLVLVAFRPHISRGLLRERFFLDVPLAIAGIITALVVFLALARGARRRLASLLFASSLVGFTWSTLTVFTYDAVAAMQRRGYTARLGAAAAPFVTPGSLLFVDEVDAFASLLARGTELAALHQDEARDFPSLATRARCAGRRVYVALAYGAWEPRVAFAARASGLLLQPLNRGEPLVFHVDAPCVTSSGGASAAPSP